VGKEVQAVRARVRDNMKIKASSFFIASSIIWLAGKVKDTAKIQQFTNPTLSTIIIT
jgi:hypothetical protein